MTREEEIKLYLKERNIPIDSLEANSIIEGIEWADFHPNKDLVYTKQELRNMGFGFDLNGNIKPLQEIEESHKKHNEYRKNKLINKACEWLESHVDDYEKYDTWCGWYIDSPLLIEDFEKAMEE